MNIYGVLATRDPSKVWVLGVRATWSVRPWASRSSQSTVTTVTASDHHLPSGYCGLPTAPTDLVATEVERQPEFQAFSRLSASPGVFPRGLVPQNYTCYL